MSDSENMKDGEIGELDFTGWPLPDKYLIPLGRITALWNSLEDLLNTSLNKLSGDNNFSHPVIYSLITHSSFPQRLDSLSSLCDLLKNEHKHLEKHRDVVRIIKNAQSKRNKFTHNGIILNEKGELEMLTVSARGKLKMEVKPISLVELDRAAMSIHEAVLALHELITQKRYSPLWRRKMSKL